MKKKIKYFTVVPCIIALLLIGLPFAVMGEQSIFDEISDYETSDESDDYSPASEYEGVDDSENMNVRENNPRTHENDPEALILEMQEYISQLQMHVVDLQNSMYLILGVISDTQISDEIALQQTEQIEVSERLMFQIEYYNISALLSSYELLKRSIVLSERELEVERVRLSLGEVTQNGVNAFVVQLATLNRQSETITEALQIRMQLVEQKRGLPGYEFIGDYTIPLTSSPRANSLDALTSGVKNNNISLLSFEGEIDHQNKLLAELVDNDVDVALIDAVKMEINRLTTEQGFLRTQLELSAAALWISYLEIKTEYELAEIMRPLFSARFELIETLYYLGEISTLEKLRLEQEVHGEIHRLDLKAVEFAIVVAQLNAMMEGVVS